MLQRLISVFSKNKKIVAVVALVLVLGLFAGLAFSAGNEPADKVSLQSDATKQPKPATEVAGDTTAAPEVQNTDTTSNTSTQSAKPKAKPATATAPNGSTQPSAPTTPAPTTPTGPTNVPTKANSLPDQPNPPAGFTCNLSHNALALKPGQETGWMTMSTSDGSNVFWEQFYKNMIWKDGVNDSPSASYWMVVDHYPGDHIAATVKFKIKLSASAPLTGSPGTGSHEEVMLFMIDASRDIFMGCTFTFTVVAS